MKLVSVDKFETMKVRYSLLIICLLMMSVIVYGQEQKEKMSIKQIEIGIQPVSHEKRLGLTFQINTPSKDDVRDGLYNKKNESIDDILLKHKSYSVGLLVNYKMQNQTILRFRFGVTRNLDEANFNFDNYYGIAIVVPGKGTQTKYHFAPGIVWTIIDSKAKFSLYGGFEIPINLHGQYKITENIILADNYAEPLFVTKLPKGYSLGVAAIFGLSYEPCNWFSAGVEFSPSLLYAKLSGKTTYYFNAFESSQYHLNDEDKGYTFYDQRLSLNLSVWF